MRLISIDGNDRMSPKGRSYAAFVIECVGWRWIQFAALRRKKPAGLQWRFFGIFLTPMAWGISA